MFKALVSILAGGVAGWPPFCQPPHCGHADGNDEAFDCDQKGCGEATGPAGQILAVPFEEDEVAFAEIVEYIRIVILMIREDLRGPEEQDLIH